jgi:hypothetical protein
MLPFSANTFLNCPTSVPPMRPCSVTFRGGFQLTFHRYFICLLIVRPFRFSRCFRGGPMVCSPLKYLRSNLGPGVKEASFPFVIICSTSIILTTPAWTRFYRDPSTFIVINSLCTSSWENMSALQCSADTSSSYQTPSFNISPQSNRCK